MAPLQSRSIAGAASTELVAVELVVEKEISAARFASARPKVLVEKWHFVTTFYTNV